MLVNAHINFKECSKRFALQNSLHRHWLSHAGIKPYVCKYCGKSFTQMHNLKSHIIKQPDQKNIGQYVNSYSILNN